MNTIKLILKTMDNKEAGNIHLPVQFSEPVRHDLIQRAVQAIQSHDRQPYGAKKDAGMRASAELSRRRRTYRGSYGHGVSRVPRKIMSRSGTRFNWVGAFAPGTVGGRRAHPPKAEKIWDQKINVKEKRKAIRSALAATMDKNLVAQRGHKTPLDYPFIVETKIESLQKTKDVKKTLELLGFKDELERTEERTIRKGKAKMRGRKYKNKKGTLLVVGEDCPLLRSAKNIRGIDITSVKTLNAQLLAPGCHAGRITLFSQNAIEKIEKEKLFM